MTRSTVRTRRNDVASQRVNVIVICRIDVIDEALGRRLGTRHGALLLMLPRATKRRRPTVVGRATPRQPSGGRSQTGNAGGQRRRRAAGTGNHVTIRAGDVGRRAVKVLVPLDRRRFAGPRRTLGPVAARRDGRQVGLEDGTGGGGGGGGGRRQHWRTAARRSIHDVATAGKHAVQAVSAPVEVARRERRRRVISRAVMIPKAILMTILIVLMMVLMNFAESFRLPYDVVHRQRFLSSRRSGHQNDTHS